MTAIAIHPASAVIQHENVMPANSLVLEVSQAPLAHTVTTGRQRERVDVTRSKRRIEHGRKLQGYVIQFESDLALVMLLGDDGAEHKYRFPSDKLKESGIRVENQPFELKETKIYEAGRQHPIYQTEFLAMAPSGSATMVKLDLGPEYDQKLKNIEAYFSDPENAAH